MKLTATFLSLALAVLHVAHASPVVSSVFTMVPGTVTSVFFPSQNNEVVTSVIMPAPTGNPVTSVIDGSGVTSVIFPAPTGNPVTSDFFPKREVTSVFFSSTLTRRAPAPAGTINGRHGRAY